MNVTLRTLNDWLILLEAEKHKTPSESGWVGTRYEREHGIITQDVEILHQSEDLFLFNKHKSDNSKTFYVLFRIGVHSDYWFMWCPTKKQAVESFASLMAHYWNTEAFNAKNKIRC